MTEKCIFFGSGFNKEIHGILYYLADLGLYFSEAIWAREIKFYNNTRMFCSILKISATPSFACVNI